VRIESTHDLLGQFPDFDGFWEGVDPTTTESTIRSLLPSVTTGDWNSQALENLIQLARALDLQKKPTEAAQVLGQARELLSGLSDVQRGQAELRWLIEHGRHLFLAMTPSKAQTPFMQAWTIASQSNNVFFAIEAALMLAIIQPPKFQNEWLQRALHLAEQSEAPKAKLWLAQLYLMDGWRAYDFRRFDVAYESFQKALDRPREKGEMTDPITIRWCVAHTLRALNRIPEALEIQRELFTELKNIGRPTGYVSLEIAECLQLLQNTEEAKPYFETAYKELSINSWYSDNKSSELSRMQYLYKKR
jgi:tetratricopeptide (TPR) repeat protein